MQNKLIIFIICYSISIFAFAEGSKDLYPAGAQGGRAWLFSGLYSSFALPFPTQGEHHVFINSGEWISIATSYQGLNNSTTPRIELYDPYGNPIALTFSNSNIGKIPNRASELSGPHFPSQSAMGNQYDGVYYQATTTGIYKVLLKTNASSASTYTGNIGNFGANENWIQSSNTNLIAAWDISVCDVSETSWISGRVYAYNFIMEIPMPTQSPYKGGLYSKLKVLTKDGFVYNVNTNGQNGISFSFMVNSRGFHQPNAPNQSIYKSINVGGQNSQWIAARYHDPRLPDDQFTTTQKIFYNIPDKNMPATAVGGQVSGQNTWLFSQQPASINNLSFIGAETTPNQMASNKGGYITFNSSNGGNYNITISPASGTQTYTPRILSGMASTGANQIYFDGKDGNGIELPAGISDVKVEFNLGEVHFPFFDMELNPNGVIIERYNQALSSIESDTVFWNDSDIPLVNAYGGPNVTPAVNLTGIPSNNNGHKWGYDNYPTYNWSGQGDNMGMDTWTYLKSPNGSIIQILVKKADLKVNITADKNDCDIQAGDDITYTIKLKNNGPSDVDGAKFTFALPANLSDINQFNFNNGNCGTEAQALVFNSGTNTYSSLLNLPNGCEVTYTIKANINASTLANSTVTAYILRPNDVNDPDATNLALLDISNNPYQPTNTQEECANNIPTSPNGCNNIANLIIQHTPTISIISGSIHDPVNCLSNGEFSLTFTNVADGEYTITYNGGTFENVTVTNGTATLTNISAGDYNNLSIHNGTCSSTANINISLNGQEAPAVQSISNQAICSGETINNIAIGGTQGATFEWTNDNTSVGLNNSGTDTIYSFQGINNGTTPLIATITIKPKKDGCTGDSTTFTITINPIPTVEISTPNNLVCIGENVLLTAVGLPANGSYSWENGMGNNFSFSISPTTTTNYFVNYNLNGCDAFDTITINVVQPIEPTFADFDTICQGKMITLPETSDNGISGTWSPTINSNETTTYTFMPIANSCASSIQRTINVREKLNLEINKTNVSCSGTLGEAIVNVLDTSLYKYSWSNGSTYPKAINLKTGIYTVTVTDTFGCESITSVEILMDNNFKIDYIQIPNVITPNDDQINDYFELPYLNTPCIAIKIDILNRWGNNVYEMNNNNPRFEGKNFSGEKLTDGVYFYRIISENLGCTSSSNNGNCHGFIHILSKQ